MFDSSSSTQLFEQLEFGQLYWFRDWINSAVPKVAAGVYTVWDGDRFIYVGMAGRSLTQADIARSQSNPTSPKGLYPRLKTHASGLRSGDQFCVYVSDRLVLPTLSELQIYQIHQGTLSLDQLIRQYIHQRLCYRFVEVIDGETAFAIERAIQKGAMKCGKPFLNPSGKLS